MVCSSLQNNVGGLDPAINSFIRSVVKFPHRSFKRARGDSLTIIRNARCARLYCICAVYLSIIQKSSVYVYAACVSIRNHVELRAQKKKKIVQNYIVMSSRLSNEIFTVVCAWKYYRVLCYVILNTPHTISLAPPCLRTLRSS